MAGSATITGRQNYVLGIGHPKTESTSEGSPVVYSTETNNAMVDGDVFPIIPIAGTSTPVQIYASGTSTLYTVASVTIKAGTIRKNSRLRLNGLATFTKGGSAAGSGVSVKFGSTIVGQWFPGSTILAQEFYLDWFIGPSGNTLTLQSQNPTANTPIGQFTTTTTTVNIDFNSDQVFSISLLPQSGDTATLNGWVLEQSASPTISTVDPSEICKPVACWGDSMTQGTQASNTLTTSYPALLYRTAPNIGRSVYNGGVAGNTAAQIRDRMIADIVRGKLQTAVIWAGRNDVTGGTAKSMIDSVKPSIDEMVANLSHQRFLIMGVINIQSENQLSSPYAQIIGFNNALAQAYPNNYLDIRNALYTDPTNPGFNGLISTAYQPASDGVHLNDAGYAFVYAQVSSFLAAKGW